MMASITRMVAALLVVALAAFANSAMAQDQRPEDSGPKIIQLGPVTEATGGEVAVFRGSAVDLDPFVRSPSSKVVPKSGLEVVGGDTLWLVDRKAGVLTGCFLAATIVAGDLRDIRCESVGRR